MLYVKLNIQRFATKTILLSTWTGSYNVTFQGKLECSSTAGSSSENSSSVTVSLYARKQNSSSATTGKSWSGSITIDGSTDAFSSMSSSTSIGNSWVLLRTYTKTVAHENNGTKTITISGSVKGPSGTNLSSATSSGSDTFTLDTIARYFSSTPTITFSSKTETSIVYTWSTSETCSAITVNGSGTKTITGTGGTSGTITITGLSANTSYTHYGTFTRSDSGLTTNSNSLTNTTYDYPAITSAPNFTIGNVLTISFSNPRGLSCAIYIIAADNSQMGGDTTTGTTISGYEGSGWQNFWYNSIPNSASGTYKVRLVVSSLGRDTTVNGGTYTINYNNSKPTFSNFEFADVNSTTTNLTGDSSKIVDGFSTLQVYISSSNKATGYKGATISKYKINTTSYNYADNFSQNIANYSYQYVNVTAIDTRGNETLVSKPVTLLGYFKPTKNAFSYARNNNGIGTQVTFNFNGTFWNNNFGNTTNSITASYKFKKTNASSWTTGSTTITPTISGNNYSFSGVLVGDGSDNGFEINSSYNVTITISDRLSTIEYNYVVVEGSPAIDLFGNCVSLGSYYDESLGGRVQAKGGTLEAVKTLYTGRIYGTESIYLNNVGKKLIVYARANTKSSIVYQIDIDTNLSTKTYGSAVGMAFDDNEGMEYYTSESLYNSSTGLFTHIRTGYVSIDEITYTTRNKNEPNYSVYYIYRIDTVV